VTDASLRERAKEELRIYAVVSLYLYVCFGALALYQDALMQTEGGELLRHGIAAIKALVIGKFLLIGRAVVGATARGSTGMQRILLRSLLLLAIVVAFSVVEELIAGGVHGRKVAETLAELANRPGLMLVAKCSLAMLIIVPLVALEELDRALGRDALRRALLT